MIEYATSVGSHNRAKKVSRQFLKDKKNQQRGHGDTTGSVECRDASAAAMTSGDFVPLYKYFLAVLAA